MIPMCKSCRLRVPVDRILYQFCNLVERWFNKLKNARRVATSYDKTAESFLAFADITSIRLWLRHFSTSLSLQSAGHFTLETQRQGHFVSFGARRITFRAKLPARQGSDRAQPEEQTPTRHWPPL